MTKPYCPYDFLPQSSGLQQKTFMGASIRGFNSNVGWGATSSIVSVDLVVDTKNGDVFSPIPVGQPAYFEYYDFYYGGIVQKYEQQDSSSGSPLFTVTLQDPKELLQGVQIITNKYYGSTYGVPNVYNVYGYFEYSYFGSSLANEVGMPWKLVRDGFQELVKITPINYRGIKYYVDFSNLNRLPNYYRIGGESNITALEFISKICQDSAVDFHLKLFRIPKPASIKVGKFRTSTESKDQFLERCISPSGVLCHRFNEIDRKFVCENAWNQNLSYIQPKGFNQDGYLVDVYDNIISKDCQPAFFLPPIANPCEARYEEVPERYKENNIDDYYNLIKIYVIDRSEIPQLGKISEFINKTNGAVSKSIGVEFRNDNNNKFLVGGQKLSFYGQYRGFDYGNCDNYYWDLELEDEGKKKSKVEDYLAHTKPARDADDASYFYLTVKSSFTVIDADNKEIFTPGVVAQYYNNPFCGMNRPYVDCGGRDFFESEQVTPFKNYLSIKFHPNPKGETASSYFYSDYIFRDGNSGNIGIQQYMGLDAVGNISLYRIFERKVSLYEILTNSGVLETVKDIYTEKIKKAKGYQDNEVALIEEVTKKLDELLDKFYTYKYFGWLVNNRYLDNLFLLSYPEGYPTDFEEMEALLTDFNYWKYFIINKSQEPSSPHWQKAKIIGLWSPFHNEGSDFQKALRNRKMTFREKATKVTNLVNEIGAGGVGADAVFDVIGIEDKKTKEKELNKLYNTLRNFASQYWGKKFIVKMPQIKIKVEPETNDVIASHIPVGAGYIDQSEYLEAVLRNIIPLCNNFRQDGKINAFLRFDFPQWLEKYHLENINTNNIDNCENRIRIDNPYSVFSNSLYEDRNQYPCGDFRKASVDNNLVFINAKTAYSPRVVMTIEEPVNSLRYTPQNLSNVDLLYSNLIKNHNLQFTNNPININEAADPPESRVNLIYYFPSAFLKDLPPKDVNGKIVDIEADSSVIPKPLAQKALIYLKTIYGGIDETDNNHIQYAQYWLAESYLEYTFIKDSLLNNGGTQGSMSVRKIPPVYACLWPSFAGVPLLSNVERYGPWYNVKANGGTTYEKDDDLVPWKYGGYINLDNMARARVDFAGSPQQESESGTIEFPGAPEHSIGDILVNGGPYINGISVSFSNGGVKTVYRLQTWSPQYGNLAKTEVDRANRLISYMNKNDRAISNLLEIVQKTGMSRDEIRKIAEKKLNVGAGDVGDRKLGSRSPVGFIKATSNTVGYYAETETSTETKLFQNYYFPGNLEDPNYKNLGCMTLDGVFRPFSTDMRAISSSGLPHFEFPSVSGIVNRSVYELNPFPSGNIHDINFIAKGNEFKKESYEEDQYSHILKGVGLRAPLVLVGWGFDTNGNPVPNSGVENDGVANKEFIYNHYKRADKWKAGPLDVAWDDTRKVWTAVGGGIFLGRLTSPLNYKNLSTATLFNPSGVKQNGEFVFMPSNEGVQVIDWLLPSGGFIPANTDVILGKSNGYYFVIGQACGPEYFNTTVY